MKLLFDQNISPRILKDLSDRFPESDHVRFVGLEDASDVKIFDFAKASDFTVVTFDSDFVDLSVVRGVPPKIIWLKTGNLTTIAIASLLINNIDVVQEYLQSDREEILELIKNTP